jgi:SAM-dependent methyltransferase
MRVEERGVRVLKSHLPPAGRVLDAGCGVGRWFWLIAPGRALVGMDFSPALLERARANQQGVEVMLGDVREIPAADASFDAVYTVKVLQCLEDEDRPTAVAELVRITREGGVVVLFEKTRGADGSTASQWRSWGEQAGGRFVEWHPNAYALLDRAIAGLVALRPGFRAAANFGESASAGARRVGLAEQRPSLHSAYMAIRIVALGASSLLEPLAEHVLPRTWAQHGIFVFTK